MLGVSLVVCGDCVCLLGFGFDCLLRCFRVNWLVYLYVLWLFSYADATAVVLMNCGGCVFVVGFICGGLGCCGYYGCWLVVCYGLLLIWVCAAICEWCVWVDAICFILTCLCCFIAVGFWNVCLYCL